MAILQKGMPVQFVSGQDPARYPYVQVVSSGDDARIPTVELYSGDSKRATLLQAISGGDTARYPRIKLAESFYVPFNDLGSGAVDTTLVAGTGSATFTRATTATTVNSAGLIVSVASGVARSYYDPTTFEYRGYLAEGARTNLLLQSQDFATTWLPLLATITSNAVTAPDGTTTADKIVEDTSTGVHIAYQNVTVVAGTVYTLSFFVKAAERTWCYIFEDSAGSTYSSFDLANGVVGTLGAGASSSAIKAYPNGWYRCSITYTQTGTTGRMRIAPSTGTSAAAASYLGDGSSGIYVWGAQLEAGSFASSYIPTTTASVTRNIDVDSYPTSGNIIAASGSYFGRIAFTHAPSGTVFLWGSYVDASNYTALLHDGTNLIFRKRIAGVNTDATQALAFTAGTQYRVACSWGASGQLIAINGASGTPHANTTAAQIGSTIQFGTDGNGANSPFAVQMDDRIWQTQFSAAQLQSLTS